jgi:hypothetical protein
MKHIINIVNIIKKIFFKELPKPTGRWKIEDCNKKMNYKVDLSNEDHCGPCGQYALTKRINHQKKNIYLEKSK